MLVSLCWAHEVCRLLPLLFWQLLLYRLLAMLVSLCWAHEVCRQQLADVRLEACSLGRGQLSRALLPACCS
jgi:hypothetical protein